MTPSADVPSSPRLKRIQRVALGLLLTAGVINYLDRSTLAIGLPLIRHDLGLSIRQSGYLLSAFLWAYAFSQLPSGALVDRIGARLMLSVGLGFWSLAQLLAGFVGNFTQFVFVRVLLGIGESPQYPTCARTVADWFARRERGFATGIWNCSSSLGTAISAPLLTFLMLRLGWRWMFATMGLLGLIVAATAYLIHRDPGQVALTAEERSHLADTHASSVQITWKDWTSLFGFSTTWGMIFGFFGNVYISWIYTAWLPQYLEIEWHLSIARTGWVAAIPFVFGVAGSIIGGKVCDLLLRRGFTPVTSRKIPVLAALIGGACFTLLAAYTSTLALAVTYISATFFLLYVGSSAAWAMATVATAANRSASLGAIQNFGGYIGGACAPIVTGIIVEVTGSFRSALVVGSVVALSAAAAHFFLVRGPVTHDGLEPGAPVPVEA